MESEVGVGTSITVKMVLDIALKLEEEILQVS